MSQCGKLLVNGHLTGDRVCDDGIAHVDRTKTFSVTFLR
jgi:hypothetical protein